MNYKNAVHIVLDVRNIKTDNHVSNSPILSISTTKFTIDAFEEAEITTDNIELDSLRDIGYNIPDSQNHVERSSPRPIKEVLGEILPRFAEIIKEAEKSGRNCYVWSSDRGAFIRALFVHAAKCNIDFPVKYTHERDVMTILDAYHPTEEDNKMIDNLVDIQSNLNNRFSKSASAIAVLKRTFWIWKSLQHVTKDY